jgi:pSer/pThr/pTyr-binding forkhead associated (FHA) protein
MKISLVVAQGVHEGKVIPITGEQFLIGRDPQCQLRPASASISKQHCGIFLQNGKVIVRDYGSTNGTFVNEEQIAGDREVTDNDHLKAGPLEFRIRIEPAAESNVTEPASTAGVKAPTAKAPAAQPVAAKAAAAKAATPAPQPAEEPDADQLAAMLLGMDDGESGSSDQTAESRIPDGTTVMDIPAAAGDAAKKDAKKVDPNTADTSSAAAAILSKYMRRPRT